MAATYRQPVPSSIVFQTIPSGMKVAAFVDHKHSRVHHGTWINWLPTECLMDRFRLIPVEQSPRGSGDRGGWVGQRVVRRWTLGGCSPQPPPRPEGTRYPARCA